MPNLEYAHLVALVTMSAIESTVHKDESMQY